VTARAPWLVRAALRLVPQPWRNSVGRDLADEAGRGWLTSGWRAVQAVGVAVLLHWAFTRTAIVSDIRYAIRSMLRARWFTVGAILTFALGIGANVTVFSAVDRMLFRTLPYARPDELYVVTQFNKATGQGYGMIAKQLLVELRQHHQGIVDASEAGFARPFTLEEDPLDDPPFLFTPISYNTLGLFGVHPLIGRDFTRDDAATKRSAALISYELWQTRFGGSGDVIGRDVWANRKPTEIVGVLPRDFIAASNFLAPAAAGLVLDPDTMETAGGARDRAYSPYVRLKRGVTPEAAAAEANALDAVVEHDLGQASGSAPQLELRFVPLKRALFGHYVDYLVLVTAAAGLVLLVACGNLASLMLVRFRSRERVAAMQAALGASTGRLVMTALIEANILSIAGAAVGLTVFGWASAGLRALLPPIFSRFAAGVAEPRVVLFTVLIAAVSTMLVAVLPAWRLAHVDAMSVLKRGGATVRGRRAGGRGLLAMEAALSVVLVMAAAATARSLVKLEGTNLGFQPHDLYRVTIRFPGTLSDTERFQRYNQTNDALSHVSGVRQAAWTNDIFLSGSRGWKPFAKGFEGQGARSNVSGGFFETLGTPMLAGRTISATDVATGAPVAVLDQSALHLVWPGVAPADAIGRSLPFDESPRREVVGVVADMRSQYGADVRPDIYLPLDAADVGPGDLIARVEVGSALSVSELRERVRQEVATPSTVTITSVSKALDTALVDQKFRATLFVSFGLVALLLAALGLYTVSTFEVTQRRAEMGIRMALGATSRDLRVLVIREALTPVFCGVAAGAVLAFWAAKFLQSFLYQLDARDPWTLAIVSLVLLTSAAVAAWVPARRASATDPVAVLRAE
jgi:predicted permease